MTTDADIDFSSLPQVDQAARTPHQRRPRFDGDDPELGRAAEQHFRSADMGEHIAALARRPDGLLGVLTRERRPELAAGVIDALGPTAEIFPSELASAVDDPPPHPATAMAPNCSPIRSFATPIWACSKPEH